MTLHKLRRLYSVTELQWIIQSQRDPYRLCNDSGSTTDIT